jgi:hypothetical protein
VPDGVFRSGRRSAGDCVPGSPCRPGPIPGRAGGLYRISRDPPRGYLIWREGTDWHVGLWGTYEDAERMADDLILQETRARVALETGDRLALCRIGWHRQRWENQGWTPYFRCRGGHVGHRIRFQVGGAPFEYACGSMECLGDLAEPWPCEVCGGHVGP